MSGQCVCGFSMTCSGLGGCCVIALLWQPATKALESPFPTGLLVCNLQHGICLEYLSSASHCKLKAFISLYFHRYIQVKGICMYIVLQTEQYKQVHIGIQRELKQGMHPEVSLFSQGSRKLCSPDVHYEERTRIVTAETH